MRSAVVAALIGLALSTPASARWGITADIEHFRWSEQSDPRVTETGPMLGIGVNWTQDRDLGWRFGYRGRLYFGSVDYNGSTLLPPHTPVNGTSEYRGLLNEGQVRYRLPANPWGAEFVAGLGLDYWTRQLTSIQSEDYRVAFLRLGADFDSRTRSGWFGGGGLKYPFYVEEDAHFPAIGFDPNPHLKPKGRLSLYAQAGYRFNPRWSLTAYYDSYRFAESADVGVIDRSTGSPINFFQPKSSIDSFGLRLQYAF